MQPEQRFLLVDGRYDVSWYRVLKEALAPLGVLEARDEDRAIQLIQQRSYDLVIVDAAAVRSVPLLVSRIRAQRCEARVVVATASPTWRRSREAFQAGATDYVLKSLDREEAISILQAALRKTPPPWPH
jgi:DNA-binding NtrC family response regulator